MLMPRRRRRAWSLLCCISLVAVYGCGGAGLKPVAEVKGTLKFEGAPLAGYNVFFISAAGDTAMGTTDSEGNFTLKTGDRSGAPVGDCKAYIQEPVDRVAYTEEQTKDLTSEDMYKMQHGKRSKPRDPAKKKLGIPAKYNVAEKSGLTYTVSPDASKNVFELNLVKK